ncbi:MAG: hypothetical protein ACYCQK_01745 [Acidiferrobacteraceae bacterium]
MTVTAAKLKKAEAVYQTAHGRAEHLRQARNALVRHALTDGWTPARIAREIGLTRSRISQIERTRP